MVHISAILNLVHTALLASYHRAFSEYELSEIRTGCTFTAIGIDAGGNAGTEMTMPNIDQEPTLVSDVLLLSRR